MEIDSSIFKAYDVRGIYPSQLNEEVIYKIGRAYAAILKRENPGKQLTVAVASDMRISSPALKKTVIQALLDSGLNVADIGMLSTPTYYFGVAKFNYDGGIQVTASHNPKEWNGVKFVRRASVPMSKDTGIMEMRDMVINDSYDEKSPTPGLLEERSGVTEAAVTDQITKVDLNIIKPFKVVADTANAMASEDIHYLFEKLPCELIKMNFDLDGTFPVHEADPLKEENTEMIKKRVIKEGADLGIATDGDGDRYFFIDEKGDLLPQDILRGIMAQIELKEHPGKTVCYDIRPGKITQDMIDEVGGKAVVTPVGHSLIKEVMLKEDAIFGGESSGHFFYKLPYGTFEAPMVLTLKLLEYMSLQGKPLSEILSPYKKYVHSGEINTTVASREAVEQKIEQLKSKYSDGKQIFIDGVTIEYPEFWFNVRASNTEPLIRLNLEAVDRQTMEEKRDEILQFIRS